MGPRVLTFHGYGVCTVKGEDKVILSPSFPSG